jgi:bifunctional UDP-N-acetylglucosamine pyrophosphorylase/glucosamine-1-phosphate N-acetyltransferase
VVRRRTNRRLMLEGVTIVDPEHTWIDHGVAIGRDSVIEPGCVIQGESVLGERVHVKPGCVIESSRLGDDVVIGPNAHLRPGCELGAGVRIGNYVEVKNSVLGAGVKADHLSYIGDADVGEGASFGCGAITVNYDWQAKHRTVVGAGARIGCNVNLIAPVAVGESAAVAAGSTITKPVPAGALAVERAAQKQVEGWSERRTGGGRARSAAKKGETGSGPKRAARASSGRAAKTPKKKSVKGTAKTAGQSEKKAAKRGARGRASRPRRNE